MPAATGQTGFYGFGCSFVHSTGAKPCQAPFCYLPVCISHNGQVQTDRPHGLCRGGHTSLAMHLYHQALATEAALSSWSPAVLPSALTPPPPLFYLYVTAYTAGRVVYATGECVLACVNSLPPGLYPSLPPLCLCNLNSTLSPSLCVWLYFQPFFFS